MGSSSNPHIELFGSVVELELEPEEPILFETWILSQNYGQRWNRVGARAKKNNNFSSVTLLFGEVCKLH